MRKTRRARRASFLTSLVAPPLPSVNGDEPIKVHAEPMGLSPIPGYEKPSGAIIPASAPNPTGITIPGMEDPNYLFAVKSQGEGYYDQRLFSMKEDGSGWRVYSIFKAEGTGPMPMGLKMMGKMSGIFNSLFNMLLHQPGLQQDVHSHGDVGPTKGGGLLSFVIGDDED